MMRRAWVWPLMGALLGLSYGFLDWGVLDRLPSTQVPLWHHLDEFIDLVLPVILGAAVGYGAHLLRRQRRFIDKLSVEHTELRQQVTTATIVSHLLHELRNPLHNLAAALEDAQPGLPEEARQLLQRNLERLEKLAAQYTRWGAVYDQLDAHQAVDLGPWLESFVQDNVAQDLRRLNIHYAQDVPPLRLRLHPVLLEQIFTAVYGNACEALARQPAPRRLRLHTPPLAAGPGVELRLSNSGQFPAAVLEAQGRSPVASEQGLGLGLVLCRRILEVGGGSLTLDNQHGEAVVVLRIPGERL